MGRGSPRTLSRGGPDKGDPGPGLLSRDARLPRGLCAGARGAEPPRQVRLPRGQKPQSGVRSLSPETPQILAWKQQPPRAAG